MDKKPSPLDLPDEVKARLDCWYKLYNRANKAHYIVGILVSHRLPWLL